MGIDLEGLRKTTENFRKDSLCLVRDSTPGFFYVESTLAKHSAATFVVIIIIIIIISLFRYLSIIAVV
jgi:hypothetical protein